MIGCPMCEKMRPVVEAAEDLIDAAAQSNNEEEIVSAAAELKIEVSVYRAKMRNQGEEEPNAVQ